MANLTATPYCNAGAGAIELVYTGGEQPTGGFIYRLNSPEGQVKETTGTGTSVTLNDVPDNAEGESYTAYVFNADTEAQIGEVSDITIACAVVIPDPDPELPETPGTATPPTPKYMAVGGTLSNPIEYGFAFQVNNALGVAKAGHYVEVNIYREDQETPAATTRARIRNGQAKVDVSRYVKALLGITPPAGAAIIQADTASLVRYHIGFVEVWQGKTMPEVLVGDKYAVNAALQSMVNDFTGHVIKPTL